MYALCLLPMGSPRTWQPSKSHHQRWMDPATPEKRAPDTTPSLAERSAGPPPSFSPDTAIEAVMKSKHPLTTGYQVYQAHITEMRSVRSILTHGGQPIGP
jgi:hypothetical protein